MSAARRNLKEADGKALVRGTRTAYEAYDKSGEFATQNEAQSYPRLTEQMRRIYGVKVCVLTRGDLTECLDLVSEPATPAAMQG